MQADFCCATYEYTLPYHRYTTIQSQCQVIGRGASDTPYFLTVHVTEAFPSSPHPSPLSHITQLQSPVWPLVVGVMGSGSTLYLPCSGRFQGEWFFLPPLLPRVHRLTDTTENMPQNAQILHAASDR